MNTPSLNYAHLREMKEAAELSAAGLPYAVLLDRPEVSVWLFAPRGSDTQGPHDRDELYVVSSGTGLFLCNGKLLEFAVGDVLFVPAGCQHKFESFSADFRTWVIFLGSAHTNSCTDPASPTSLVTADEAQLMSLSSIDTSDSVVTSLLRVSQK